MTFQLTPLLSESTRELQPYQPGMTIDELARKYQLDPQDIVKLASNENPLGPSPLALEAFSLAALQTHRYPDQHQLIAAIAKHLDLAPNMIVLGNGSNDVLDLIARVFLRPGISAVSAQYAFPIYTLLTQLAGAENIVVQAQEYTHHFAAIKQAITSTTRVVWIANPNNPTGSFASYGEVKEFLASVPGNIIVVLDEAYYEYLDDSDRIDTTQWLKEFPNLILTRTFSKIYGLAGLRIGYGLASPEIIEVLNRVRQPFNVSLVGLAAAEAALGDAEFVEKSRSLNHEGREYITNELKKLGLNPLPSWGNFVAVQIPEAASVHEKLLSRGIITRPLAPSGLADFLRISVGTAGENSRLVAELQKILSD